MEVNISFDAVTIFIKFYNVIVFVQVHLSVFINLRLFLGQYVYLCRNQI